MINNAISLGEWLERRPAETLRQEASAIAHRAAMRFFPLWSADLKTSRATAVDGKSLKVARVHLCLSAALLELTDDSLHALKRACAADPKIVATRSGLVLLSEPDEDAIAACIFAVESYETMAARHSKQAVADLWASVEADANALEQGGEVLTRPLWDVDAQDWFTVRHEAATNHWRSKPNIWGFWLRWWEGVVSGRLVDLNVQHRVAEIMDEVWHKGPEAVANEIAEIDQREAGESTDMGSDISSTPRAALAQIEVVRVAMERNRRALPPTFDAIEGLILLEIERLQSKNDRDHEWDRQMRVYLALHDAVVGLRANLPATGPVTARNAEESERLIKLYLRKFGSLPREKVDDVINGVFEAGKGAIKVGLIGATSLLAVSYDLPVLAGVTVGSMVFAPKNSADLIRAAREAILSPKSGG
jgi:hypothetical protein